MQGIVDTVRNFVQAVLNFFQPVVVFFVSVSSIVAFLLGAIANPQGFANSMICGAIDIISNVFPSTPSSLKLGNILNSISSSIPAVGCAVLQDVFVTVSSIFAIMVVVKIYKLIPFKAT